MREVESWIVQGLLNNASLVVLVGKDADGNPAIFSNQARLDSQYVNYPHVTVARIGSAKSLAMWDEQPDTAGQFDCPLIALQGWSKDTADEAYQVYLLAQQTILGQAALPFTNEYFNGYKIVRRAFRDNLFDERTQVFHTYGEFSMWAQLTNVAQPF